MCLPCLARQAVKNYKKIVNLNVGPLISPTQAGIRVCVVSGDDDENDEDGDDGAYPGDGSGGNFGAGCRVVSVAARLWPPLCQLGPMTFYCRHRFHLVPCAISLNVGCMLH